MPRNTTPRVFISYCRHDEDYASLLEEYLNILKSDGKISVFRDRHLETGAQWEERLRQEIASADIGICLLTPAYLASRWCRIETLAFAEQARTNPRFKVLPIHLRHCPVKLVVPELLPFQILPSLDESVVGQVGDRLEEAGSFFSHFIKQLAALLDDLDPDPDPPSAPSPGAPGATVDLGEVRARDNVVSLKAWKKKQGSMLERWVRRSGLVIDFGTSALVPIAARWVDDPAQTAGRWLLDNLFGQQERKSRRDAACEFLGYVPITDLQLQLVSGRRWFGHPLEDAEDPIGHHQEDRLRNSVFLAPAPGPGPAAEVPVRENLVLEVLDGWDAEVLTVWYHAEAAKADEKSVTTSSSATSIRWLAPTETWWWQPEAGATWSGGDLVPRAGGSHRQDPFGFEEAHQPREGSGEFRPRPGQYFGGDINLFGMLKPVQQPGDAPHAATTPTDCPRIGDLGWLPSSLEEVPVPNSPLTH